ncbi:ice-binding family protein [Salinispirillum marinum]|uniref:Ice-binding family protein n=2 Tax=Saccharospirillaceae TaxID=255527 RepID=A0ABV8BCI8_9GAMM
MTSIKRFSSPVALLMAMLAFLVVAGCNSTSSNSDDSDDGVKPTVLSTGPVIAAVGVSTTAKIVAAFSVAMNSETLTTTSMTLGAAAQSAVVGQVTYDSVTKSVRFAPTSALSANTLYTATITTAAKSADGVALASAHTWTFTTGEVADVSAPTVSSTQPANAAVNVPRNRNITASFSEVLNPQTITSSSFTLQDANDATVAGDVSYLGTTATFNPTNDLAANTEYTATLTTGMQDLSANALAANSVWTFTTSDELANGPAPVNLGSAGNYAIVAKTGISTTGVTAITGDLALSPAAETLITGFSQSRDASDTFSTSGVVTGNIYAANMAVPTPATLTTAISDMETAYTDAAGRSLPDFTELGAGNVSGMTLTPGLYKWGTGLLMTSNVTLSGDANAVWIFQVASNLTVENGVALTLTGGALAENVFWQVAGSVTFGTTSSFVGIVMSQTNIDMQTGSSLSGRTMAQTAVTLDATTVTQP